MTEIDIFSIAERKPDLTDDCVVRFKGSWYSALYTAQGWYCPQVPDIQPTHWFKAPSYDYTEFPKIARLRRRTVISEKIDGTNGQIAVSLDGEVRAGRREGWLTRDDDSYGFAKWAYEHTEELRTLGPGRHFGEWWGRGIGRGYGLSYRRFSLFNTLRWVPSGTTPKPISATKMQQVLPPCCGLVPVMYDGVFSEAAIEDCLEKLRTGGSLAMPGFPRPEGVVIYHEAARTAFKRTLKHDDIPKGLLPAEETADA